jgi:hypothetical protein
MSEAADIYRIYDLISKQCPFGRYQFVQVTFPFVSTDVAIYHTLDTKDPDQVGYISVQQSAGGRVSQDTSVNHTPWQKGVIYLRSSSVMTATLLLFTPSMQMPTITPRR